ncbi:ABC transporter permease [Paenibacillus donghaensis]|uniref:Transport permease protein n=1 Tax=Paenibacillus donghaensis TaxID=414771 RepID=A0A2Z2K6R9_9BACL|nr:ABC transporter permease [Paenibacillus donghaensis]ASA20604.1 ABC transporter [Paenibacillus donghaensis]
MEAVYGLWQRALIKFIRDKFTIVSAFALPFLFLVVFGSGMSGAIKSMLIGANAPQELAKFDFIEFMFPGIVSMAIFTASMFSGFTLIQDRQFGYMKEVLVSPVSRVSVALGTILGCSTSALIQGLLMLVFVPFIGMSLSLDIVVKLLLAMLLVSFTLSSISILLGSFFKNIQGYQMVVQVVLYPMFFLSGAFFPLNGIPRWMEVIVKLNPMTYVVDFIKRIVLDAENLSPVLKQAMGLNLEIFNHPVTAWDETVLLLGLGVLFTVLAAWSFSRVE